MMGKFKLDKSSWNQVRFGDVVNEVRATIKEGEKESIECYVGLEHIDPKNIHITKWGLVKDGTTFTRKFEKGQVLFGRRRAYLKKAGLATFCGLCSGDIIVMEAKEKLSPELLPFLINNDHFFNFAVNTSAGSLSPRTKFKYLAEYKFLLTPKNKQPKIAELLWAMDDVVEREKNMLGKMKIIYNNKLKDLKNVKWERYKLRDLIQLHYGKGLKEADRIEGEYPIVGSSGISGTHNKSIVSGPGIVVGRKGNAGQVIWVDKDFWPIDTSFWVEIKKNFKHIPLKYFYYLLKIARLKDLSISTAVPGLNRDDALLTTVFIPNKNEIKNHLNIFLRLENSIEKMSDKIENAKTLQKSLIDDFFS